MSAESVVAGAKLSAWKPRYPLLDRPGLTDRLDSEYRLALVSAAPGYGKTATLSSWAREQAFPVAWLSCGPADDEPLRFISGLLSAVSATWPGSADDAFVLLRRDGADLYDVAVSVANELSIRDDPGAIIVDDLHLATQSQVVMSALLEALPDQFRLIAGTRWDPPLSLARLRLHGDLLELRSSDLQFDATEMSRFFELRDIDLGADDLVRLHELTEGWPAGAQLAAIALQRGGGVDTFIADLADTDRSVGDFLLNEVLNRLPPELTTFLGQTSVLDAFDAELCEAVTGVDRADVLIERLVAENLFVLPTDEGANWYRYHHLFGAFLRARLAAAGRSKLAAAHARASRALADRGDTAGALQHCLATGDVERAGEILRSALQRAMSVADCADGATQALRQWLQQFGTTFLDSEPVWVAEFVNELIILNGAEDAGTWLDRLARAHPAADGQLAAIIAASRAERHLRQGQSLQALRWLQTATDAVLPDPPTHGVLALLPASVARAHIQGGDWQLAASVLERPLTHPTGRPIVAHVHHPGIAAYVAAQTGELSRAEHLARGSVESAEEFALGRHGLGQVHARLALLVVSVERNELETALEILDDLKQASEETPRPSLRSLVKLHQAQLARVLGDEVEARELLVQSRLLFAEPDAPVRDLFDAEAAAQALRFDLPGATELIAGLNPARDETKVLRARLALLEHDHKAAAAELAALPATRSRRSQVGRSVLLALTCLERDVEAANRHLADAFALAQPERLVRSIVDQGPQVHKLLLSCLVEASQTAFLEELLLVTSHMLAPVRARTPTTLPEPLSQREVTVLRYLGSRLTYREIAAALYVSVNTLKSHVRTVYRKLGVESREEALDAGRRCGLI